MLATTGVTTSSQVIRQEREVIRSPQGSQSPEMPLVESQEPGCVIPTPGPSAMSACRTGTGGAPLPALLRRSRAIYGTSVKGFPDAVRITRKWRWSKVSRRSVR